MFDLKLAMTSVAVLGPQCILTQLETRAGRRLALYGFSTFLALKNSLFMAVSGSSEETEAAAVAVLLPVFRSGGFFPLRGLTAREACDILPKIPVSGKCFLYDSV